MTELLALTNTRCAFWHRWELIKDTGANRYHECRDCGSRRAVSYGDGYQPIDQEWLLAASSHQNPIKN